MSPFCYFLLFLAASCLLFALKRRLLNFILFIREFKKVNKDIFLCLMSLHNLETRRKNRMKKITSIVSESKMFPLFVFIRMNVNNIVTVLIWLH